MIKKLKMEKYRKLNEIKQRRKEDEEEKRRIVEVFKRKEEKKRFDDEQIKQEELKKKKMKDEINNFLFKQAKRNFYCKVCGKIFLIQSDFLAHMEGGDHCNLSPKFT